MRTNPRGQSGLADIPESAHSDSGGSSPASEANEEETPLRGVELMQMKRRRPDTYEADTIARDTGLTKAEVMEAVWIVRDGDEEIYRLEGGVRLAQIQRQRAAEQQAVRDRANQASAVEVSPLAADSVAVLVESPEPVPERRLARLLRPEDPAVTARWNELRAQSDRRMAEMRAEYDQSIARERAEEERARTGPMAFTLGAVASIISGAVTFAELQPPDDQFGNDGYAIGVASGVAIGTFAVVAMCSLAALRAWCISEAAQNL